MHRIALLALSLAACGAPPAAATPAPAAETFVDAETGERVPFEAMVAQLQDARVVYVGERHDDAADHAVQLRVARALAGDDLALGFEMFQRPYQSALDAYVAEEIDEPELLARTEWETRWGFDFGLYRDLVRLGRETGAPLVALNAPRELTRRVAREGLDALDEETRAGLPELDLEAADHRAMFDAAMTGHPGMDDAMRDRFYAAQVIWDETMAESVARWLDGRGGRVIVFAGVMHVRLPAIPARAARRGAAPYAIVLPVTADELAESRAHADFLVVR
ncbi:MAG: ChaN family lipoprotein [Sandaracinaceae bacterium]|nr:iron-regulated protein [Myxococcales bacterium]